MRRPIDLKNGVSIGQPFGAKEFDYTPYGLIGHHGQDYPAPEGQPIYAPEAGTILQSANGVTDPKSGRFAAGETIVMSGKYEHWLMHLSRRLVNAGSKVSEGQLIGYSGNTGVSTGAHLHWGTRPLSPNMNNGYRGFVDPSIVLNSTGGSMSTTDLGIARVIAHGVLGRNGLDGRPNALAGASDTDLNRNHVGKETNGKIWEFYNSAEGKAYRDSTIKAYQERDKLRNDIKVVTADRNQLITKLATANSTIGTQAATITKQTAEINALKEQLANTSGADETTVVKNWFSRAVDKIIFWNKEK